LEGWLRQAREGAEGAPSSEEGAEIRELKRELERVRRERKIEDLQFLSTEGHVHQTLFAPAAATRSNARPEPPRRADRRAVPAGQPWLGRPAMRKGMDAFPM
jgi:hypothetical protein